MSTSFFDTTINLWSDAFLAGRGVILTMITMATTTTKTRGDFDNDDDGNNDHKDDDNKDGRTTSTSFFDTAINLWVDAFLEVRGGDFNYDDDGNNAAY